MRDDFVYVYFIVDVKMNRYHNGTVLNNTRMFEKLTFCDVAGIDYTSIRHQKK